MLEVLQLIWRFRQWVAYVALSAIIAFLYAANSGIRADLASAKLKNVELQSIINLNNQTLEQMAAWSAQREKEAAAALKAAEATANGHSSRASQILMAKPKSNDECVAALELLKEYQQ